MVRSKKPKRRQQHRHASTRTDAAQGIRRLWRRLGHTVLALSGNRQPESTRKLTAVEIDRLLESDEEADEGPAVPLAQAFAALPGRRRAILVAVLGGEDSRSAIAARFGISMRALDAELRLALEEVFRYVERQ